VSIRKVILVVLATLVIFAAGVITGGVLVKRTTTEPARNEQPIAYFPGRFDQVRRAINDVELRAEQRVKVDRIIRESQEEIADYFLILAPDFQTVFFRMRDNIFAQLDAEQRRRFEELMKARLLKPGNLPNANRKDFPQRNNFNPQNKPMMPPRDRPEFSPPGGVPRNSPNAPVPEQR
jgi:uncharacterized membrane protein